MDNALTQAHAQKEAKYRDLIDRLQREDNIRIDFQILTFGVLGAIPRNFENMLKKITTKSRTEWLIDEIMKALLYHNHQVWITRDQLVRGNR